MNLLESFVKENLRYNGAGVCKFFDTPLRDHRLTEDAQLRWIAWLSNRVGLRSAMALLYRKARWFLPQIRLLISMKVSFYFEHLSFSLAFLTTFTRSLREPRGIRSMPVHWQERCQRSSTTCYYTRFVLSGLWARAVCPISISPVVSSHIPAMIVMLVLDGNFTPYAVAFILHWWPSQGSSRQLCSKLCSLTFFLTTMWNRSTMGWSRQMSYI